MKVLLLKDVANLGQQGEIKEAKDGYARNFLIAQGIAKPATPQAMKEAEKKAFEKGYQKAKEEAFKEEKENRILGECDWDAG